MKIHGAVGIRRESALNQVDRFRKVRSRSNQLGQVNFTENREIQTGHTLIEPSSVVVLFGAWPAEVGLENYDKLINSNYSDSYRLQFISRNGP